MYAKVLVQFDGTNKKYCYRTVLTDLEQGDRVVVDSSNGLGVATVLEYTTRSGATAWVVQKVDMVAHQETLKKALIVDRLKKKMTARFEAMKEQQIYEMMAKEDIELFAMMEEMKKLTGE